MRIIGRLCQYNCRAALAQQIHLKTGIFTDMVHVHVRKSKAFLFTMTIATGGGYADADITVFDPDTVKQVATPANGGLPSTGIPYVVVNGTIVVKDSKVLKDVFPGKPIRLPVKH